MLRLSNKGLYGIKALYELAKNYGGSPVKIREISDRHGLPVQFLEQVLHQLKNAGIVTLGSAAFFCLNGIGKKIQSEISYLDRSAFLFHLVPTFF